MLFLDKVIKKHTQTVSAFMLSIVSISSFHSVFTACTLAHSALQIIEGKKKKITCAQLLTTLFVSGARDTIYHGKQLGFNNSQRETIRRDTGQCAY